MIRLKTRQLIFLVLVFLKNLFSAAAAVVTLSAGTCSQTFCFCWCPLGCGCWLGTVLRWDQDCSEGISINYWLPTNLYPQQPTQAFGGFPNNRRDFFFIEKTTNFFILRTTKQSWWALCHSWAIEVDCILVKRQEHNPLIQVNFWFL